MELPNTLEISILIKIPKIDFSFKMIPLEN